MNQSSPSPNPYQSPTEPSQAWQPPPGEDKLEGYWKAIIWGSLLVPCLGGWVIVVLSSVMYYVWESRYPNKARSINRHGWAAWLTGQALGLVLYFVLQQLAA